MVHLRRGGRDEPVRSIPVGSFPDYPDPDDYTGPFYLCDQEWMVDHYCNKQVNADFEEEASSVPSVVKAFAKIQMLTAEDPRSSRSGRAARSPGCVMT